MGAINFWMQGAPPEVRVPNYVGMNQTDAAAILNPPLAEYPAEAQKLERQTIVGVVASIASDGALLEVRLVQSSGIPALDARTLEFVRGRYSWTPAQISGKPVRSEIRLVVRWFPERAR